MAERMKVKLGKRSHCVYFQALEKLPAALRQAGLGDMDFFVLTDKRVARLYGRRLSAVMKRAGMCCRLHAVAEGERSKSFSSYQGLIKALNSFDGLAVRAAVIAFGGGVVGDLGGFLAATYKRGVPLFQVPTSLLAQVDSSLGGKTGIDYTTHKNLVGSFYQPRGILVDVSLLETLRRDDYATGLAEVIKYGVIKDARFFADLEGAQGRIMARQAGYLRGVVRRCLEIKRAMVERDERDTSGVRIILNFGHTIGHAAENAAKYGLSHGKAVAVGMLCAAKIALLMGLFSARGYERLHGLVEGMGLPTAFSKLRWKDIHASYVYDKKFTTGKSRLVLPVRIGRVRVVEGVPLAVVRRVVTGFLK